ncbi:MAG: S-layer homology domain-containing protein [Ruminiclostridium sp.]|nr:S-layer homology domain-containing protein [Ruminiclostridium sp.]
MKRSIINLVSAIILITLIPVSTFAADSVNSGFSDIGSHWSKDYIIYLTADGAIKGFSDGTFRPENKITRAEFTAILLRALKNDVSQPKEGKWYSNYIAEAANRKYILSEEFDDVEKNITRGEMARMIVRTMNETYPANMVDYASRLSDYGKTPDAYKDFVLKAYVKGIITGRPGGIFAYADPATRAEAAVMIVRLVDTSKRVIPAEPVNNDVYMYEVEAEKEVKVETSHPELLTHIRKGMEILSGEGYTVTKYSKKYNVVYSYMYKDKVEADKPIGEGHSILGYHIYTEQDPRSSAYLPYQVSLYDTKNTLGQQKFKELVKDIFPEAYDKIIKELDNKSKDINYQGRVWEKVNGREIRVFTFEGYNQIDIYIALENE